MEATQFLFTSHSHIQRIYRNISVYMFTTCIIHTSNQKNCNINAEKKMICTILNGLLLLSGMWDAGCSIYVCSFPRYFGIESGRCAFHYYFTICFFCAKCIQNTVRVRVFVYLLMVQFSQGSILHRFSIKRSQTSTR